MPHRRAEGTTTFVSGKTALVLLDAGGSLTGRDIAISAAVSLASVAVLTNNADDREAALEAAAEWIKTVVRHHSVAAAAEAGFPALPLPHWPAPGTPDAPLGLRFALALLSRAALPNALPPKTGDGVTRAMAEASAALMHAIKFSATSAGAGAAADAAVRIARQRADSAAIAALHAAVPFETLVRLTDTAAAAQLNMRQCLALAAAHTHRVTAIRGPPGTGKTKAIAAVCTSFADGGGRTLVLAPSNAATKRILESLLAAGCTTAALMVSRGERAWWPCIDDAV